MPGTPINYDAAGQRGRTPDGYDSSGNAREHWTYVELGNRLESNDKYRFGYDQEGNLKFKILREMVNGELVDTSHRWDYDYDQANRLIKVSEQWHDGTVVQQRETYYGYDAEGNLVESKARNVNTNVELTARMLVSAGQVVADLNVNNELTTHYLNGDGANEVWGHVSSMANRPMHWFVRDEEQSIIAVTDDYGALLQRTKYLGFGQVEKQSDSIATRLGYRGDHFDKPNSVQISGGKTYDPELGRWITESGTESGDTNPYRYLRNNPKEEEGRGFLENVGQFVVNAWDNVRSIPSTLQDWGVMLRDDFFTYELYTMGHRLGLLEKETLAHLQLNSATARWMARAELQGGEAELQMKLTVAMNTFMVASPLAFGAAGSLGAVGSAALREGGRRGLALLAANQIGKATVGGVHGAVESWARGDSIGHTAQNALVRAAYGTIDISNSTYYAAAGAAAGGGIGYLTGGWQGAQIGMGLGDIGGGIFGGAQFARRLADGKSTWLGGLIGPQGKAAMKMAMFEGTGTIIGGVAGGITTGSWEGALQGAGYGRMASGLVAMASPRVQKWLTRACFTPGTLLLENETSSKAIELFRSFEEVGDDCDYILTRDENNPYAPLVRKRVLRKFVRVAPILTLHVGGRIIETTGEHPFHVRTRASGDDQLGWVAAGWLEAGDVLLSHDGQPIVVEGIADSGRVTTVYNLEVEDSHTYFVGAEEWGFSVWSHNLTCGVADTPEAKANYEAIFGKGDATKKTQTLKLWLKDERALLADARRQFKKTPQWQGIDPDSTPVFYRTKAEVDAIRAKPGESGGHHPHGLALGGPEGQVLTLTGDTRYFVNPNHSAATGLQKRILNVIKAQLE